jgi:hypothetical protein
VLLVWGAARLHWSCLERESSRKGTELFPVARLHKNAVSLPKVALMEPDGQTLPRPASLLLTTTSWCSGQAAPSHSAQPKPPVIKLPVGT